ncbi:MAG: hypothetical protein ACKVP0_03715 [Pirellulaceae bacterium]
MAQDTFVNFTSHLGTTFVAPSKWTSTDKGDTFALTSQDGLAAITAIVNTVEGSGTLSEYRESMANALLPKGASRWKDSKWSTIKFGNVDASKRELIADPETEFVLMLYVVESGDYYHLIILHVSKVALELNGEFYENVVCTFETELK